MYGLAGTVSDKANNIAGRIKNVLSSLPSGSWGGGITSGLASGMSGMFWSVRNQVGNVSRAIGNGLSRFGSYNWGYDLMVNLNNGIVRAAHFVTNSVRNVAQTIWNYIHFSEPDVGPLSDFHTYMPDMMRGLAQGIDRNSYLVTDSVENLTRGMSLGLSASVSYDYPSAEDVLSSAVERGMVSVVLGQQGGSDRGTTVVLRVDSEDLAKAVLRGNDRLAQRNPLAFA
jgi:hypothetical protein